MHSPDFLLVMFVVSVYRGLPVCLGRCKMLSVDNQMEIL